MISLETQLISLAGKFSLKESSNKGIYEIQLFPKLTLVVDVSNYPKKPKIKVPKQITEISGELEPFHPMYENWDKRNPPLIADILKNYRRTMEMISGIKAYLKKDLIKNITSFAEQRYPEEGICVLRCLDGALSDLVMNPGSSSTSFFVIFNPRSVGYDKRLIATCHFHPSGTANPSPEDRDAFKMYPINIILGYPYSIKNFKVFNNVAQKIDFEIID